MTSGNAAIADVKAFLRITGTSDDTELQDKLDAAIARVNDDTGRRRGYDLDASPSARIYTPHHRELLLVDDIGDTSALTVELGRGTSWTTVDPNTYDFLPENAIADGRAVEVIRRCYAYWPLDNGQQVRVTTKWGWPAFPKKIKAAQVLIAARLFRRKDSPEGVAGFNDLGVVRLGKFDPDYDALIGSFVRDVH